MSSTILLARGRAVLPSWPWLQQERRNERQRLRLWHATEVDAFWIFVRMMEDYELRDNYLPKLPGLDKHC